MNLMFVKHFLVDNGSYLSTTLVYNFDIGRPKLDSGFQKFWGANFEVVTGKSHGQDFQKKFRHSFSQINLRKSHKVSLNFIELFRRYY